ncbi:MAG: LytR C-terminal domain-containing protein [Patescibacteria group bacterium]
MRAKKKLDGGLNNTKIAIKFFAFVFIVILISLIFKGVLIVSKSRFDTKTRFTISVTNGKDLEIISFSPKSQSISVLKIEGDTKSLNINRFLEIPIDGEAKSSLTIKDFKVSDLMLKFILNYKSIRTNLTIVDILRLYLFSKTLPINYIYDKKISTSENVSSLDKIIPPLFSDEIIEKENVSIKIVNGINVTGLGNRLGRLITNMGGNVVIIASSDSNENISTISYFGKKTYTVEKISKILGFKLNKLDKKAIADIVIVIGKDSLAKLNF